MDFPGQFESHYTITAGGDKSIRLLEGAATVLGLKLTHIVLHSGSHPSQPMLTGHGSGTLSDQLVEARQVCSALAEQGWMVNRVKIEAGIENAGVPSSDEAAGAMDRICHFEHHIKLSLPLSADLDQLIETIKPCRAQLSRNALRTRTDGRQERFVTQRCYGVGCESAGLQFNALLNLVAIQAFEIVDVEREYVVYDSNVSLDDGWIMGNQRR